MRKGERLLRAVGRVPWAIQPEKLEAIVDVLELRLSGVDVTVDVESRFGAPRRSGVALEEGGVAVLPLVGIISQRMNLLSSLSGGTSTEKFAARFDELMKNQDVSAIVIDVDSPGGSVEGVEELSKKIYDARVANEKRVIAVVNPLMASAAYWIGSAAHEVVVTPSGAVGSIGVFTVHTEFSAFDEAAGVTHTLVKAGRYKAEANDFQPLEDGARDHMQSVVDDYYSLFAEGVARNRGVSAETVRTGLGEGRAFPARRAIDVGLADRVGTLEEVLVELGVGSGRVATARNRGSAEGDGDMPDATQDKVEVASADGAGLAEDVDSPDERTVTEAVQEEPTMQHAETAPKGATDGGAAAVATVGQDGTALERERAQRITELCALHGLQERAGGWIGSGASVDQVVGEIFELKGNANAAVMPEPQKLVDMTAQEESRFSILRAINAAAENDWSKAGFEREISQEIEGRLSGRKSKGGFYVPTHLSALPAARQEAYRRAQGHGFHPQAALTAGTATEGAEFVFTEPGSFIEMLRTRMVTAQLGATFLPGLEGNVDFPKQTGAGQFSWRAEDPGSDVADSDAATIQVQLRPRDGTSSTSYSRRFLAQSVIDAEQFVRADFAAIAARGIDRAALHGAGGNEPTGLYNASGVNAVAMGGVPTWATIVDLETQVVADDADIGVMAYATTPEIRGVAKVTEKAANTAQFLWAGSVREGEMNGFRAMASNQIRKDLGTGGTEHGILFGVWDQLLIGEWGAMEIIVDPYAKKKQGLVELTLFVIADVAIRHPEAFSKGTGLTTS